MEFICSNLFAANLYIQNLLFKESYIFLDHSIYSFLLSKLNVEYKLSYGSSLLTIPRRPVFPISPSSCSLGLVISGSVQDRSWDMQLDKEQEQREQKDQLDSKIWTGNTKSQAGNTKIWTGNTKSQTGNTKIWTGNTKSQTGNTKIWIGNTEIILGNTTIWTGNTKFRTRK